MQKIKKIGAFLVSVSMVLFFVAVSWVWASSLLPLPEGVRPNISENIQRQSQPGEPGYESEAVPTPENSVDVAEEETRPSSQAPESETVSKLKNLRWPAVVALGLAVISAVAVYIHERKVKQKKI